MGEKPLFLIALDAAIRSPSFPRRKLVSLLAIEKGAVKTGLQNEGVTLVDLSGKISTLRSEKLGPYGKIGVGLTGVYRGRKTDHP